ncbi:MAG: holo-ACP synthase [Breznakia sp.]
MIVGVGCDIVEIKRIVKTKEAFAKRILTKREYALYKTYKEERSVEFLAGRFAAKEAIVKAMGQALLLSDIEILYKNKKPVCKREGYNLHISIAHEKNYAIAYVVCER